MKKIILSLVACALLNHELMANEDANVKIMTKKEFNLDLPEKKTIDTQKKAPLITHKKIKEMIKTITTKSNKKAKTILKSKKKPKEDKKSVEIPKKDNNKVKDTKNKDKIKVMPLIKKPKKFLKSDSLEKLRIKYYRNLIKDKDMHIKRQDSFNKLAARISVEKYEKLVKKINKISEKTKYGIYTKKNFYGKIINKTDETKPSKVYYDGNIIKMFIANGDYISKGEKIAKISSPKLYLETQTYLRLKKNIKKYEKLQANFKEDLNKAKEEIIKILNKKKPSKLDVANINDLRNKVKSIEDYKNKIVISATEDKKTMSKIEVELLKNKIKPSNITEPIKEYNYISLSEGKVTALTTASKITRKDNLYILEQKNKYYLKVFIPLKYIESIDSNTMAVGNNYNKKVVFDFTEVTKEIKPDLNSVGVIFETVNPESEMYNESLINVEIKVY